MKLFSTLLHCLLYSLTPVLHCHWLVSWVLFLWAIITAACSDTRAGLFSWTAGYSGALMGLLQPDSSTVSMVYRVIPYPRLRRPTPAPDSGARLRRPTPAPDSGARLRRPTPAPDSGARLRRPTPAPDSGARLRRPTPAPDSGARLRRPTPASDSDFGAVEYTRATCRTH